MIDYDKLLSKKVLNMKPSGIRRFFDIAADMKEAVSLGIGEPDFVTPYHIRRAGIDSLEKGRTYYTSNSGLTELRVELAKYMLRRFDLDYDYKTEAVITVGGSEAIDACIRAVVNYGDEVLIPEPSFVCYAPITDLAGGVPVIIPTKAQNNFKLTAAELEEKITPRTKLLILPYPNNPTGAIMEKKDIESIAKVLKNKDILVLSDEIYAELTYTKKHFSIAQIDYMKEKTILVSGFSKCYAMTGWRLGYVLGPAPIVSAITKIHQYAIMSTPTTSQYAAIEALKNGDADIEYMKSEYDIRRRYLVSELNAIGMECFSPLGAFYVFPSIQAFGLSSEVFCERLLYEKKCAIIPGNAFGDSGEGFVRISYAYSLEKINIALERIKEFIGSL